MAREGVAENCSHVPLDIFKEAFFFCSMVDTTPMDFSEAIAQARAALVRIVAALFAMLGLAEGVALGRISRVRKNAVLRVLRPAEAAVRRLIVAAARGVAARPRRVRPFPKGIRIAAATGTSPRTPAFRLSDDHGPWLSPPGKRRNRMPGPRVRVLGGLDPTAPALLAHQQAMFRAGNPQLFAAEPGPAPASAPQASDGMVEGRHLERRLRAIMGALNDIPRQAQRLANWKARRQAQADQGKPVHTSPLREVNRSAIPDPPSYRDPPPPRDLLRHAAEDILSACDCLARQAMRVDTS